MGDSHYAEQDRRGGNSDRNADEARSLWRHSDSQNTNGQRYRRRSESPSHSRGREPRKDDGYGEWHDRRDRDDRRGMETDGEDRNAKFERRRQERRAGAYTIWAPSPPPPSRRRSLSPTTDESRKKSKKSKRSAPDSDAESRDERRRSKKSKKSRKSGKHKKKSSKKSKRSRSVSPDSSDSDVASDRHRRKKRSKASKSRSRSRSVSDVSVDAGHVKRPESASGDDTVQDYWAVAKGSQPQQDDLEVGPLPMPAKSDSNDPHDPAFRALMPGEGSAMAAYVAAGKRIPRRGEVGLQPDEIEGFEKVGFVMSGSRHRRMNAIRMRKENQIITAEEKRALMTFNQEEKMKREAKIIADFKEIVSDKVRRVQQGPAAGPQ
ncbi:hypothetical protein SeMB42_g07652 [Synchytrium endobioticum]|uniref:NF-kappa-B-activating protein C-terminal domain-containing protein n=1 Tax=Synchytrium endobioticum TaxID=286115 RepID=A0A507DGS6_9FUNG|nr:hypothetical protein SeMB42_g07652 [Synchytrium endobioticum]TPX50601.1 hypothetical protein SeLEV6574_g00789 [Synchytrium endobioticum]